MQPDDPATEEVREALASLCRPIPPEEIERIAIEARRKRSELQEELDRRMRLSAEDLSFIVY